MHNHGLILIHRPQATWQNDRGCDLCDDPVKGLFYRCNLCDFNVHPLCTQLPEYVRHVIHEHHYLRLQRLLPGRCMDCKDTCSSWRYRCGICSFDLHIECVLAPLAEATATASTSRSLETPARPPSAWPFTDARYASPPPYFGPYSQGYGAIPPPPDPYFPNNCGVPRPPPYFGPYSNGYGAIPPPPDQYFANCCGVPRPPPYFVPYSQGHGIPSSSGEYSQGHGIPSSSGEYNINTQHQVQGSGARVRRRYLIAKFAAQVAIGVLSSIIGIPILGWN